MGDIHSLTSNFDVERGMVQKVHLQRVLITQWMRMLSYHLAHQCHLLLVKLVQQQLFKFDPAGKDLMFIVYDVKTTYCRNLVHSQHTQWYLA